MSRNGRRLIFHAAADRDASDIAVYLESREPGLSDRFLTRLREVSAIILERPRSFPAAGPRVRRAKLDPFKIGVYFVVQDDDRIAVLAILDLRRDPATVRDQLRSPRA